MNAQAFKTRSELALEHLESLKRPLTDQESDQLRRALHAVYCRNRARKLEREQGAAALKEHKRENEKILRRVCAEYAQSEADTLARVREEAA